MTSAAKNSFFDLLISNQSDSFFIDHLQISKSGNKASYELVEFTHPKVPLKLIKPLQLEVIYETDFKRYVIENKLFKIFSFNENFQKAAEDFELNFYSLWEEYVLEDESVLTSGAVQLKLLLLEYAAEL